MEEEIDLKEIFDIFWAKKLWIILAGVIGLICAIVYTGFVVTPQYSSTTTLLLTKSTGNNNLIEEAITQSDITLNQKLITTYSKIIKSKAILNKIIEDLNLDTDYKALYKKVEVKSVSNTDIMEVTVTTDNAELSANIVNYLTEVFEAEIFEHYKIKNTSVIDYGEVDLEPVNVSWIKNIVIFGAVAVIFAMMIIFVVYFFDTTIKSKQDAEKLLNIPVLAVIPIADEEEDKKNEKKNR